MRGDILLQALVRADAAREHELAQSLLRRAFAGTATDDFSPLELDAVGLLFQVRARDPARIATRPAVIAVPLPASSLARATLTRALATPPTQYVARTQQGRMPQVQQPQRFLWSSTLKMDASTRYASPQPGRGPGLRRYDRD